MQKYVVELTAEERFQLKKIVQADRVAAYRRRHAQMLMASDQGPEGPSMKDVDVAAAFGCTTKTAERLRRRCVEHGVDAALEHGNRGCYRVKALDGEAEAHVIALACGEPPDPRTPGGPEPLDA